LLFCLILSRKHTFRTFLSFFGTNYKENDRKACYIIRKLYPETENVPCI
jgi:hypothetical protein